MQELSGNVVALLQYLVPGFVVAWIYYGFTSHPKPSQFERIVQALVFTVLVRLLVAWERFALAWIGENYIAIGTWTENTDLAAALLTALLVGLMFAGFAKGDWVHVVARRFRLSTRSGYPNEHYAAFDMYRGWVVLHLNDGTRLFGYPLRWPTDPSKGHYLLEKVERTYVGEADEEREDLTMLAAMLISSSDVQHVEFVKERETTHEPPAPSTTTASAATT